MTLEELKMFLEERLKMGLQTIALLDEAKIEALSRGDYKTYRKATLKRIKMSGEMEGLWGVLTKIIASEKNILQLEDLPPMIKEPTRIETGVWKFGNWIIKVDKKNYSKRDLASSWFRFWNSLLSLERFKILHKSMKISKNENHD
jgi:hypothetical protein